MLQVKKKFDSNIHLLYYLSGTNHIFATLVYNFFFFLVVNFAITSIFFIYLMVIWLDYYYFFILFFCGKC